MGGMRAGHGGHVKHGEHGKRAGHGDHKMHGKDHGKDHDDKPASE